SARVLREVADSCDLEPHEVVRVVRDPLGIRLGKPHGYIGVEAELMQRAALYGDGARAVDPRPSAVRRSHRRRDLDRARHTGLPLRPVSGLGTTRWSTPQSRRFGAIP